MPLFDDLGRIGARYKLARSARRTVRIMNALPPEIQRDLDWHPPSSLMASIYRSMATAVRR
ncbi:hypothetical protein N7E70_014210 [Aminobacter sp. NyZ550]|jgi:hypothetical protein|uniref:hypothetical protein n=1 Tax=Aminobacter TaxID=31988 RepID=UPI00177CED10|nr:MULTISPECIES: hypothetical protein [unclassified Aminobacter]QOF71144.1 hypothetical protein IG197_25815 [Aminobacter sp. SR38]WAX92868.1 hypothetical protein N7E70_014210 [Aminobacter sp. NyZ550]